MLIARDEQRAALDAAWDKVVADYGDESLLQADLDDAYWQWMELN